MPTTGVVLGEVNQHGVGIALLTQHVEMICKSLAIYKALMFGRANTDKLDKNYVCIHFFGSTRERKKQDNQMENCKSASIIFVLTDWGVITWIIYSNNWINSKINERINEYIDFEDQLI